MTNALPVLKNKMGIRAEAFKALMPKLTRIGAAHKASSKNKALKDMVKGRMRKIRGQRANPLPKTPDGEPTQEQTSAVNTGYEDRAADLAAIVATLYIDTEYKTNQADLTKTALAALLTQLQEYNGDVRNAQAPVDNARAARNGVFYLSPKNLVDVALLMKEEVKSTYGTKSPQYKQVRGLKFTRARP